MMKNQRYLLSNTSVIVDKAASTKRLPSPIEANDLIVVGGETSLTSREWINHSTPFLLGNFVFVEKTQSLYSKEVH